MPANLDPRTVGQRRAGRSTCGTLPILVRTSWQEARGFTADEALSRFAPDPERVRELGDLPTLTGGDLHHQVVRIAPEDRGLGAGQGRLQ